MISSSNIPAFIFVITFNPFPFFYSDVACPLPSVWASFPFFIFYSRFLCVFVNYIKTPFSSYFQVPFFLTDTVAPIAIHPIVYCFILILSSGAHSIYLRLLIYIHRVEFAKVWIHFQGKKRTSRRFFVLNQILFDAN